MFLRKYYSTYKTYILINVTLLLFFNDGNIFVSVVMDFVQTYLRKLF
jgi:hypothetical protein